MSITAETLSRPRYIHIHGHATAACELLQSTQQEQQASSAGEEMLLTCWWQTGW